MRVNEARSEEEKLFRAATIFKEHDRWLSPSKHAGLKSWRNCLKLVKPMAVLIETDNAERITSLASKTFSDGFDAG